jgi:2-iminoacetate synthase ThiH
MTTREIERLIVAAGREPIERDTLYNVVHARAAASAPVAAVPTAPAVMPG